MDDVSEDLAILYRAVSRTQGRVVYAGRITASEALRLVQLGLARLIDIRARPDEHQDAGAAEAEAEAEAEPRYQPAPLNGAESMMLPSATSRSAVHDFGEVLRGVAAPTETLLFIAGTTDRSHEAATLAARAGFHCALNVLDGREQYRDLCDRPVARGCRSVRAVVQRLLARPAPASGAAQRSR